MEAVYMNFSRSFALISFCFLTSLSAQKNQLKKTILPFSYVEQDCEIKGSQIGVVEIRDGIYESKEISLQLRALTQDKNIKAILLMIDSGGGAAGHGFSIFNEVIHASKKKPVIAFIESFGCSAAFLISCGASKIVASAGAGVGSIGVLGGGSGYRIIPRDYHDGRVVGSVEYDPIVAGHYKDINNPYRELSSEDREYLENEIQESYKMFCATIAKQRKLDPKNHEIWADGKVIHAYEALKLGLIDTIGSLTDAIECVKIEMEKWGISTKNLVLVSLEKPEKKKSDKDEEEDE